MKKKRALVPIPFHRASLGKAELAEAAAAIKAADVAISFFVNFIIVPPLG